MKKLLSVLLTLCLLLTPAFALAEGSVTQLEISQIELMIGDESFDFGLNLLLTLLSGDKGISLVVGVADDDGNSLAEAGLTADENGLTGMVDGMNNAYHITTEELMELASSIEEELGMSLSDALDQALSQADTLQSEIEPLLEEAFTEIVEVLDESEAVEREDETVYVLEEEYLLHRADVTVSADQVSRVMDAVVTLLDKVQALYPDKIEVDVDDLQSLEGSLDVRLWMNDEATVYRGEFDLNLINGDETFTLPIVLEMVDDEVNGLTCDLSTTITEDDDSLYFLISYSHNEGDEGVSQSLTLYMAEADAYEITNRATVVLSADTDAEGETTLLCYIDTDDGDEQNDMGVCYIYENTEEDDSFLHDAYMDLWYTSYMDGEEVESYEVDFLLTVTRDATDLDGTLDLEGVPLVNLSEMTEEQLEQAENELYSALQSLLLGLMNDTGVQQLITLFTGVEE